MDREKLRLYFNAPEPEKRISKNININDFPKPEFPSKQVVRMLIGTTLVAIALFIATGGAFFLLIILSYLIYLAIRINTYQEDKKIYESLTSGKQADQWIDAEIDRVCDHSEQKFNIDKSQLIEEQITIGGLPNVWQAIFEGDQYKLGIDGIYRFNPINICSLNFTDKEILIYNCLEDLFTGEFHKEINQE